MYSWDWFYAMLPPGWSERPKDLLWCEQDSLLPLLSGTQVTCECSFSKSCDVLVFGGAVLVTDAATDATVRCPLNGDTTGLGVRLYNRAGNETYSDSALGNVQQGFVPAENLFAVWQSPGQRPVFWPIPIAIGVGGSLTMDVIDRLATGDVNVRFSFACACLERAHGVAA